MRDLPIDFEEPENTPIAEKRAATGIGAAGIFLCLLSSVVSATAVSFLMANSERKAEVLEVVGVKGQIERRVNPLEPIISELKTTMTNRLKALLN